MKRMNQLVTLSLILTLVLMAGTSMAQEEANPSTSSISPASQKGQANQTGQAGQQVELNFKTSDGTDVDYLLYLPKNFKDDGKTKFPLILFLHGRGESNGPVSLVAKWGPPKFAKRGDDLPYIMVSPQCPKEDWWSSEVQQDRLDELFESVVKSHPIDSSRMFLTGLSMGGYGSWAMAARHPERFAAVAPVCGGGDPKDADKLKDVAIWAFHGDQDRAVKFEKSVEMVEAIRAAGGKKIRFTTYEHLGHNCWSPTYAMPALYEWMEQQGREKMKMKQKQAKSNQENNNK